MQQLLQADAHPWVRYDRVKMIIMSVYDRSVKETDTL